MGVTANLGPRGELAPEVLLAAYTEGYFPMAEGRWATGVDWYTSDPRGVLPLDGFHVPRRLARRIRGGEFQITFDARFEAVIRGCAEPRQRDPETWISEEMILAYTHMHHLGHAHSVEAWREGRIVGGIYGLAVRGAFFAESMFHREDLGGSNASKVALVALVECLRRHNFRLLDIQMVTPTTRRFGALEISQAEYLRRLGAALAVDATFSCADGTG